jgi:hypothetical protein
MSNNGLSLEIDLYDKQAFTIVASNKRINIWEGAVRSGKTIGSILRWCYFIERQAPKSGSLAMVGKTQTALVRNILDPMMAMFPNDTDWKRGTGEFTFRGRNIEIIGANDERAQEKIRGRTMAGVYGDEITLWPESFWVMMLSRLSVKGAKFFGTTNPDSPYHYLKKNYIDRKDELDMSVFHFKLEDNEGLDPDYVHNLKTEYTGLWYKRFIDGLWVQAEGAIYDMYDPDIHVIDCQEKVGYGKPHPGLIPSPLGHGMLHDGAPWKYFIAIDYGTSNPCVFGLFAYKQGKPPCYLVREYYYDSQKEGRQKTDNQYADDLQAFIGEKIKPQAVYVDPSSTSFIVELKRRGLNVIEAKNDVIPGIRFVSTLIRDNLFYIDKTCINTQEEFSGYVWDAKAQEKGEDKPIKFKDHAPDMVRYGLYTHFFREAPLIYKGFNLN